MKTRLDIECICLICSHWWSIIDIETTVGKEVGSGFHLSKLKCPNCEQQNHIDFDIVRSKLTFDRKEREEYLQELRTEYRKNINFSYPKTK